MNELGFYSIRAYVPEVALGQPHINALRIVEAVKTAYTDHVDCMVFPELCMTGYTCADLFAQELLLKESEEAIKYIAEKTAEFDIFFVVGAPVMAFGKRYNCGVAICNGEVAGMVPKSYLPNYGEFYEKRWFEPGIGIKDASIEYAGRKIPFGTDLIFSHKYAKIGIEICEDLWVPNPPSSSLAMAGADVILNLSASDDLIGKFDYLKSLVSQQSARCRCAYAYASAGWGESSTDLVFSGKALIATDGELFGGNERFSINSLSETRIIDIQKLKLDRAKFNTFHPQDSFAANYRLITIPDKNAGKNSKLNIPKLSPLPFVPQNPELLDSRCGEIINIQAYGLMRRLHAIGCRKTVVGISGGLDSTLALLVTVKAFDLLNIPREGIVGITMPGLATTGRTKNNALDLMKALGVTSKEIPIGEAVAVHFKDIGQNPETFDATYENSQARERTQILMDMANKEGGILIGTGDMSELALGWCTYNGDQMSMYGVNASVPKTLVKHLVEWFASKSDKKTGKILRDICDTPISPELIPSGNDEISQKTEDLVGPYELHDFFLYHFLRNSFSPTKIFMLAEKAFEGKYDSETILKWLKTFYRRFFSQQFKRSCMPDGPKVGSVNLSPRGDWRMPSDASAELWLRDLEKMGNCKHD